MDASCLSPLLSRRSAATVAKQRLPWRFAPAQTYDAAANPDGLISFGLAENVRVPPTRPCPPVAHRLPQKLVAADVESFVNRAVSATPTLWYRRRRTRADGALQVRFESQQCSYAFSAAGGRRFTAALAVHLNESLRPHRPITADHIRVTGSATPLHEILAWALADPGHAILTSRPVYGRFELDFGNRADVDVVYADTDADTCFDAKVVVAKFDEAIARSEAQGVTVKAVLIVNPHNPLGRWLLAAFPPRRDPDAPQGNATPRRRSSPS